MTTFKNVTVTKAANSYFGGKVTSRKISFPDNKIKTLGIMMPGEYEFATESAEVMEIIAGDLDVMLPNTNDWQSFQSGQSFNVPANSKFQLKIRTLTDYCCSYIL